MGPTCDLSSEVTIKGIYSMFTIMTKKAFHAVRTSNKATNLTNCKKDEQNAGKHSEIMKDC